MKKIVLITIVVVALVLNIDLIFNVDSNIQIIILLALAGSLSVYEYKRTKKVS